MGLLVILVSALLASGFANEGLASNKREIPSGFVVLDKAIPGLELDLRYSTGDNFVSQVVDGYQDAQAILSAPAAEALARVQASLAPFGLGILLFDAAEPKLARPYRERHGIMEYLRSL